MKLFWQNKMKQKSSFLVLVALLSSVFCAPTRATWYNENIPNGTDIIMMDIG
ncbi:MAG: hypothetical protein Q4D38_14920 [Planctomycetia bacterium]|nr:hypothetical protein [Planctomycetia bacterium]